MKVCPARESPDVLPETFTRSLTQSIQLATKKHDNKRWRKRRHATNRWRSVFLQPEPLVSHSLSTAAWRLMNRLLAVLPAPALPCLAAAAPIWLCKVGECVHPPREAASFTYDDNGLTIVVGHVCPGAEERRSTYPNVVAGPVGLWELLWSQSLLLSCLPISGWPWTHSLAACLPALSLAITIHFRHLRLMGYSEFSAAAARRSCHC